MHFYYIIFQNLYIFFSNLRHLDILGYIICTTSKSQGWMSDLPFYGIDPQVGLVLPTWEWQDERLGNQGGELDTIVQI